MGNYEKEVIVLGDEAVSYGAIDSGLKAIFAYPGTPSTEIFEGVESIITKNNYDERVAEWVANEKVSYELALGVSYQGYRTMVCMKHVGLNVAMDPFVNSALTGIRGGMVVAVADDPSMHSSQNEQDSRYLADFSHIPCLEPSTPQEVYDYTYQAFEISEKLGVPVLLRLVTRLAHSRGIITRTEMKKPSSLGITPPENKNDWILLPSNARIRNRKLRAKLPDMIANADKYNELSLSSSKKGVVLSGMGRAYYNQMLRDFSELKEYSKLEVSAYPVNNNILQQFINHCDEIYIFEEDYPYLEDQVKALSKDNKVYGRRDEIMPFDGELNPTLMRKILVKDTKIDASKRSAPEFLVPRPPKLCDGCGHQDAFKALREALNNIGVKDPRVFGDIGCYTLGALPPFDCLHTCVEMGASIGMALGAAHAGMSPSVAVLGDSTFFHSGLPTLISMAKAKVNVNLVVMDNRITAMTGQQETVATDMISDIAKSMGFEDEQIYLFKPLPQKHQENVSSLEKILQQERPALIIFKRECIQALRKGLYKKIDAQKNQGK